MVDWNGLVIGPLMEVFGEPVTYTPAGGSPISLTAVFDEAYTPVQLVADPSVMSVMPVLGVQLSQMPVGYDPENAQGDQFTVRGHTYVVKAGKPDSHGAARLEANLLS